MGNEIVERVAIAIKNARALPGTSPVARLSDVDRRAARAAIAALREPSDAMIEAGRDTFLKDMRGRKLLKYLFEEDPSNVSAYGQIDAPIDTEVQNECAAENVAKVLRAMIDTILTEGTEHDQG